MINSLFKILNRDRNISLFEYDLILSLLNRIKLMSIKLFLLLLLILEIDQFLK